MTPFVAALCNGNIKQIIAEMSYLGWTKKVDTKLVLECESSHKVNIDGFQLEFVSIGQVINHKTCYNSSSLIGWNYSIQTGEQIL